MAEYVAVALTVAGAISTLAGAGNWLVKLIAALAALSDLLAQKKIRATEAEMKLLLEAAVAECNDAFHRSQS